MFGLFKHKGKETIAEYREAGESLGVFTLSLTGVEDPFDPDPLWDRRYGGNSKIAEEKTGDREFRLQAALDGCRDIKHVRDAEGRFREQTPVFTDVVMWIADAKWRADSKRRGKRLEALASNLAQLHRMKFKRSMPPERDPNYTIMPDEGLEANTIVFQFGFGVFVPTAEDEVLGSIQMRRSREAEPVKFEDWSFWRNGAQIKRPVGVYAGQGSILLTPDRAGPVRAPLWFGRREGNISLNLSSSDAERVYSDSDHVSLVQTISPKHDGEPFHWILKDKRGPESEGDDTVVIEVKFVSEPATRRAFNLPPKEAPKPKPMAPPPAKAAAAKPPDDDVPTARKGVPPARAPQPAPASGAGQAPARVGLDRFFGGAGKDGAGAQARAAPPAAPAPAVAQAPRTPPPAKSAHQAPISQRYSLKLTGCALLRIDGQRRLGGLEQWTIWFDRIGRPVRAADKATADIKRCLALQARADAATLFYRLPGQSEFSPVNYMPSSLDTGSGKYLELLASPVPEVYHGLLMLRQESSFPLSTDPFLLGRSDSAVEGAQPDLPMELLDHPDALAWAGGQGPKGARLNALNLSRRHVSLTLSGSRLEISMADGKMPSYVLDQDGKLIRALAPGDRGAAVLEPDEMFIVGSYLLRFNQEKPQVLPSRDATILRGRASKRDAEPE